MQCTYTNSKWNSVQYMQSMISQFTCSLSKSPEELRSGREKAKLDMHDTGNVTSH